MVIHGRQRTARRTAPRLQETVLWIDENCPSVCTVILPFHIARARFPHICTARNVRRLQGGLCTEAAASGHIDPSVRLTECIFCRLHASRVVFADSSVDLAPRTTTSVPQ